MRSLLSSAGIVKMTLLLTLLGATLSAQATTYYVDVTRGVDTNPGTFARPLRNIGTALTLANNLDTVAVANGTYTGVKNQNLDTAGKSITFRSLGGAINCIIDCQGQARAFLFHSDETANTRIIGFTIQNGKAPDGAAGGIDSFGNGTTGGNGSPGGAIDIENSSPTIEQCVFVSNAGGQGGRGGDGVVGTGGVLGNVLGGTGGTGGDGGAVEIKGGSPLLMNCIFLNNHAGDGGSGGDGYFDFGDGGYGGYGANGGAISVTSGNPGIVNGLFVGNRAGNAGGIGMNGISGGGGGSGGAISAAGGNVLNCTVTDNAVGLAYPDGFDVNGNGGGIYGATVTNSIVFGNTGDDVDGTTASYSDIGVVGPDGFTDNGHNLSADPLFVRNPGTNGSADYGDLHLKLGSPCLNAGNTAAPGLPAIDLDGQPRQQRGGVDLGAYELVNSLPTLTSLSPANVAVGGSAFTLTLTGTNFNATSGVLWNGATRSFTFVSATTLKVNVTAADIAVAGTIKLNVSNPGAGGGTSNPLLLTVSNPAPTLTSVAASQAPVGSPDTTITLTGTNFVSGSVAFWSGTTPLSTHYVSATTLTAVLPARLLSTAGTFGISVGNPSPGGGATGSVLFVVGNPMPTLSSLSPSSVVEGSPDTTVTINGTGFFAGAKASLGNINLATSFVSSTQLSVVIPASLLAYPTSANITVTNPSPSAGVSSPLTFTVTQGATTLALVANSANQIARVKGGMVVIQAFQNTGSYTATGIQITSATLAGTGSTQIVPSGAFNLSKTGVYPLLLKFPAGAAAIGSTPTLTVTYTSANAGSGTLTFVCGIVH